MHARITFTLMNKYIAVILALIVSVVTQAEDARGSISLKGVSVSETLRIYSAYSETKLVIEPSVTNQSRHIDFEYQGASRKEAAKLLGKALRKQADIVITQLDDKQASVKLVKK